MDQTDIFFKLKVTDNKCNHVRTSVKGLKVYIYIMDSYFLWEFDQERKEKEKVTGGCIFDPNEHINDVFSFDVRFERPERKRRVKR